tara:strand:- start:105 stop:1364 length:1260 start_codon:yes stop_codon:yes gene_type:complete
MAPFPVEAIITYFLYPVVLRWRFQTVAPKKISPYMPYKLAFLLASMVAVTDIHVPSLPQMMADFQSTEQVLQLTLTLCCLGFLVSGPFIGPVADAFGRRATLLSCIALHIASSLVCSIATNLETLMLCRIIQGAAAAGGPIISLAIVADIYKGERFQQITALLGMVLTFSLSLAPILGGYIGQHYGWRATFVILSFIIACATFVLYPTLPETLVQKRSLTLKKAFQDYKAMILNWRIAGYAFLPAILIATIIAYTGMASYYFVDELGITQSQYGYFQGVGTFGNALFCLFTSRWVIQFGAARVLKTGMMAALTSALLITLFSLITPKNPYLLTIPLFIFGASIAMTFSPATHKAIEPYLDRAGTASAFLSMTRMIAAVFITSIAGFIYTGTAFSLGLIFIIFALITVSLYLILEAHQNP